MELDFPKRLCKSNNKQSLLKNTYSNFFFFSLEI